MPDIRQNEVGWLITKEHVELEGIPSRVGWGQLRVHSEETDASFDRVIGRTIFMDKSITEHMMPEEVRVRWRSFEDDGFPAYDGIVNVNWIFGEEDNAYNIDRFNESDVGAVHVYYSADDIMGRGQRLKKPEWVRFAENHVGAKEFPGYHGSWIEIYC